MFLVSSVLDINTKQALFMYKNTYNYKYLLLADTLVLVATPKPSRIRN